MIDGDGDGDEHGGDNRSLYKSFSHVFKKLCSCFTMVTGFSVGISRYEDRGVDLGEATAPANLIFRLGGPAFSKQTVPVRSDAFCLILRIYDGARGA